MLRRSSLALAGLLVLLPIPALAGQPETVAEAEVEAETTVEPPSPRSREKWLKRWAPTNNYAEIGIFGGFLVLDDRHELFDPRQDRLAQGWLPLRSVTPEFGARIGYYPLRFVGIEAEAGVLPTRTLDDRSAVIYAARGHVVGQLGLWAVTPFVLVGGGLIGIASPADTLGRDIDPALDFGGGVKVHLDRWVLRLDLRDVVTNRQGVEETFESHNFELLFGLSVMLGRKKPKPEPEPEPDPEPEPLPELPEGPDLIGDSDGDGFFDDRDACIDVPGVDPDGCPPPDSDGDGILDVDDSCVDQPETRNGFEDADGCPDEVPEAVAKFNGKITGITFDTGKATIRRTSLPVLDEAVRVLTEHPSVRIEIAGHTDDQGEPADNLELSQQRAGAVKMYLEGMGIAPERMTTAGFGEDKPIDTNETKAGRANNRRIEFRILTD